MNQKYQLTLAALTLSLVTACGGDSSSNRTTMPVPAMSAATQSYRVTVKNLGYAQPLSPIAVILHSRGFSGWVLGAPASVALEELAEGGDNMAFRANGILAVSGSGAIGPGGSESVDVTVDETDDLRLTVATMLVNTNDGFTGVTREKLDDLAIGESRTMSMPIYDAGTEANMELSGTIPGPADGGEGFNEARDDVDYVARHPGVVTGADGYADSILDEAHRFDSPIALLTIERME